jgi:hypothetical protein
MEQALSSHYIKGFNNAYFLAEHNSALIEMLIRTETDNDFIQGLKDGKKTYDLEQQKSRIKELQKLRSKNQDKDLER